mmetsp:Transcript_31446/g.69727  ORF Transcript_31446/g.69727 Transcript_31446/m.69727 type:complete len:235 (-) Transcript_31446:42-746(-)
MDNFDASTASTPPLSSRCSRRRPSSTGSGCCTVARVSMLSLSGSVTESECPSPVLVVAAVPEAAEEVVVVANAGSMRVSIKTSGDSSDDDDDDGALSSVISLVLLPPPLPLISPPRHVLLPPPPPLGKEKASNRCLFLVVPELAARVRVVLDGRSEKAFCDEEGEEEQRGDAEGRTNDDAAARAEKATVPRSIDLGRVAIFLLLLVLSPPLLRRIVPNSRTDSTLPVFIYLHKM